MEYMKFVLNKINTLHHVVFIKRYRFIHTNRRSNATRKREFCSH